MAGFYLEEEEEEEEVQQLILAIGGGRRPFEWYPEITQWVKGKHFQNSCYHCNFPLLYFNIHYYIIEHQDFRLQVDSRRWLVEGLKKERRQAKFFEFWYSYFGFWISSFSLVEILLINQKVGNKKWLKTEGIFSHSTWTYSLDITGATRLLDFWQLWRSQWWKEVDGSTKFKFEVRKVIKAYSCGSQKKRIWNF